MPSPVLRTGLRQVIAMISGSLTLPMVRISPHTSMASSPERVRNCMSGRAVMQRQIFVLHYSSRATGSLKVLNECSATANMLPLPLLAWVLFRQPPARGMSSVHRNCAEFEDLPNSHAGSCARLEAA